MDKGLSYTYPVTAFPRVKHLQDRLVRLTSRWQKILNKDNLPDCVFQGRCKEKKILSLVDESRDKVTINVFVDSSVKESGHPVLHVHKNLSTEGVIDKTELSWSQFIQNQQKKCGPIVTVALVPSLDVKNVRNLESQLSGVTKAQLQSMIIYVKQTETNHPYNDLVKVNFNITDLILADNKHIERSSSLSKQIQYMFEQKVVKVLEMISDFNADLIPRKQEDCGEILQDAVRSKLVKSLKDRYVVHDLSPDSGIDGAMKKPTDQDLSRLAAAVGSNWEMMASSLGITVKEIEDIKQSHQSMMSKILNMFYLWRNKNQRATLMFLLRLTENMSSSITADMSTVKAMKKEIASADSQKDLIFHTKLMDFVVKKTKCEICDLLSKKYGLSANQVNEFLNDGFYGYEKKATYLMKTLSLPSWPQNKPDEAVDACRKFAHICCNSLSSIIQEVENYVKAKRECLTVVKKLQFELEGLLQLTEVTIETHIPDLPKLSPELQDALLRIPEVYGCGIMWGDLTLHLTAVLSADSRNEVRELLSKYNYTYGYCTQLIQLPKAQAGGHFTSIEQGSSLRAERSSWNYLENQYSYGSLGCFVKIKSVTDTNDTGKLHCITCAHCVIKCENRIYVQSGNDYEPFGEKKYVEYFPDSIDIATIEVFNNKLRTNYERGLRQATFEETPLRLRWSFYNDPIVRRTVFKFGSSTKLTSGICLCDDYKTKEMLKNYNQNSRSNFGTDVNILIEVEPGAEFTEANTGIQGFSADGDSGSVVYDEDMNGDVLVLALLYGSISDKENKFLYSYASHISRLKERLENRHNISIEPACNM